jgi:hypothetical protein
LSEQRFFKRMSLTGRRLVEFSLTAEAVESKTSIPALASHMLILVKEHINAHILTRGRKSGH